MSGKLLSPKISEDRSHLLKILGIYRVPDFEDSFLKAEK